MKAQSHLTELKTIRCPYEKTIYIIGNKWSLLIIKEFHLKDRPLRFNALLESLHPISSKTLSAKLKDLVQYGILRKEIVSTTPLVANYELTEKGKGLVVILDMMADWSREWNDC